ncbi:helix-turn-helix domain-containing protein [Spirosoma arcticum]
MITTALVALTCGSFLMVSFLVFAKSRTQNTAANRWLGLFLALVGLLLAEDVLSRAQLYGRLPHLFGAFDWVVFSVAPCLYVAIRHFTNPNLKLNVGTGIHFLPSLLFVLLNSPLYVADATAKQQVVSRLTNEAPYPYGPWYELLFIAVLFLQLFTYWGLSFNQLLTHQRTIRQISASVETVDLHWLLNVLIGVLLLLLVWLTEGVYPNPLTSQIATIGYLAGAYYIGYYATQQTAIYPYPPQAINDIAAIIEQKPLKVIPQADGLKEQLTQLMVTRKPYLDNTLNLPQLAGMMNLSTHDLSALINTGLGMNFYQFVNTYRVEESKRLLTDPAYAHLSMVGIAYEAGFNSKTVFNTTFKASTGLSPTAYRSTGQRFLPE